MKPSLLARFNKLRTEIETRYLDTTLEEVQRYMETKHGFNATKDQYKAAFNIWGTRKYKPEVVMRHFAYWLKIGRRDNKKQTFSFDGKEVSVQQIDNWSSRWGHGDPTSDWDLPKDSSYYSRVKIETAPKEDIDGGGKTNEKDDNVVTAVVDGLAFGGQTIDKFEAKFNKTPLPAVTQTPCMRNSRTLLGAPPEDWGKPHQFLTPRLAHSSGTRIPPSWLPSQHSPRSPSPPSNVLNRAPGIESADAPFGTNLLLTMAVNPDSRDDMDLLVTMAYTPDTRDEAAGMNFDDLVNETLD